MINLQILHHRWSPVLPLANMLMGNRFVFNSSNEENSDLPSGRPVYQGLLSRLSLPIHRQTSIISAENTLTYLYEHMRCGIHIMIRNNRLVIFCPFVNKNYENNWGDQLKISEPSLEAYYQSKSNEYRHENIIPDKRKWWANGNIICNEHCRPGTSPASSQWWGDNFLFPLKDMIAETCMSRSVSNHTYVLFHQW